jgi:maltose O-acetyltransferase
MYFSITSFVSTVVHSILLRAIMLLRIAMVRKKKGTRIYSNVFIKFPKHVSIGQNSFINYGCVLWAAPNSKIVIGNDVILGPRVTLISSNHGLDKKHLIRLNPWMDEDIIVGNDVWLGANSTILAGVTIGDGAVVAAHAVVTGNVDARTIVGGVPARVIGVRK